MATTVAELQAKLSADTGAFDRGMGHAEGRMKKGMAVLGKLALAGGAAVATGVGYGAVKSIQAASDLGEQINKTNVVFGRSGREVQKWASGLTRSFGLSQRAALEAAGTYGNMLKPMGLAPPLVATMSKRMVELAGDMASFNNASPEDTLDALRSGLAGETEPLRRYGVFLNDARLKQEAVKLGLISTIKDALTPAAKAQATYSLIMKDTTDTQGDFARTASSLPNLLRTFRGELENAAAAIGQQLLPVAVRLAQFALPLVVEGFEIAGNVAAVVFPKIRAVAGSVVAWFQAHWPQIRAVGLAVLSAVSGFIHDHLVPAFFQLRDHVTKVVAIVVGVFNRNKPALLEIWRNLKDIIRIVWQIFIKDFLPLMRALLPKALNTAIPIIRNTTSALRALADVVRATIDLVHQLIDALNKVKGPSLQDIKGPSLIDIIRGRQAGGAVAAGRPYIVGEKRPELFVPRSSGTILPRVGGGGTIVVPLVVDGRTLARVLIDPLRGEARMWEGRNGRPAF